MTDKTIIPLERASCGTRGSKQSSCIFGVQAKLLQPLEFRLFEAYSRVEQVSRQLVERIEAVSPRHPFGRIKCENLRSLQRRIAPVARAANFSNRDVALFEFVCRVHDIGQHVAVLLGDSTLTSTVDHGRRGVELLDKLGVVQSADCGSWSLKDIGIVGLLSWSTNTPLLSLAESRLARFAIEYHSTDVVPRLADARAYRMCYILRDLDKEALLLGQESLLPEEIWCRYRSRVLAGAGLSPREERAGLAAVWAHLNNSSLNKIAHCDPAVGTSAGVGTRVPRYMCATMTPASVVSFKGYHNISREDASKSFASELLYQLGQIFDIASDDLLRQVAESVYFWRRLQLLRERTTQLQYRAIQTTLYRYFEQRLNVEFV